MTSRRTTVIALGGLLAGGGTLLGTGAFSTVTAARSVSLQTAGDANAFLALEVLDDAYVDETDGTVGFTFDILAESTTTFADLVNVRNNGTQAVTSLRFALEVTGAAQSDDAVETALQVVSGDASIDAVDEANLLTESNAGGAADDVLTPGEAVPFGIAIDLIGADLEAVTGNPDITLTIIADTGGASDGGSGGDESSPTPTSPAVSLVSGSTRIYGSPPRNLELEVETSGGSATISSFMIEMDPPGNGGGNTPETFASFSVEFTSGRRSGSTERNLDEVVSHEPYELGDDETATYTIAGFDANLNNTDLTFTLESDDETELVSQTVELTQPSEG